jgi:hypothetical protein
MKPIKSPCFDLDTYKAPATSSLKERIKLNKMLTVSPKDGKLIGINTHRITKNRDFLSHDFEISNKGTTIIANSSIPTV